MYSLNQLTRWDSELTIIKEYVESIPWKHMRME